MATWVSKTHTHVTVKKQVCMQCYQKDAGSSGWCMAACHWLLTAASHSKAREQDARGARHHVRCGHCKHHVVAHHLHVAQKGRWALQLNLWRFRLAG